MRLKRKRRKQIHLHPLTVTKDGEGVPKKEYGLGIPLNAIVWPATSELQIAQYGNEINKVMNVKIEGKYQVKEDENIGIETYLVNGVLLKENDGIRINSTNMPDYKIVSIKPYDHLFLEVKKL